MCAMARVLLLSIVVACATSGALAQDPGDVEIGGMATSPHPIGGGDEKLEKIGSFAPPETSAEENDSVVLPRHLRCDGMWQHLGNQPLLNCVGYSMPGSNPRDD